MADAGRPLAGRTILLLPRYTDLGPSSRMRMGQFVPMLEAAGATVQRAPFFSDAYLHGFFGNGARSRGEGARAHLSRLRKVLAAKADLAWIERELFPFLPGPFERAMRLRRIPYVVDFDDAVFHRYDRHRCWAVRRALGRKFDPLLKGAAAATPGNGYLADYARAHGATRVMQLPTVVDPRRYPLGPPPAGDRLRIGWIGTPENARYLAVVTDALRLLGSRVDATLVTIGAPELPGLPVPQEAHAWSEAREGELLSTIDIGVMPLKDNSYERGKCGYKLIQYMAAGRAVIGSPVGVNREIVDPSVGLLATTADEWAQAIATLYDDPSLRLRMGEAGRAKVEEQYAIDVAGRAIVDLFTSILASR